MKVLRVLDSSGDRVLMFDDTEASAQARAEDTELFERLLANGFHSLQGASGGKPDEKVNRFSNLENETIVVPRIVGG